jgi:tetratricopeptide (TPR) repeat protein
MIGAEPWTAAVQDAVNLSRRGEYRKAVGKYAALLSNSPVKGNAEIYAYLLSQMADSEMELGSYVEAEAKTRQALQILISAGKARTSTFAIAEGVLAEVLRAERRYAEAKRMAYEALALGTQTLSPTAPRLGILVTTLEQILQDAGDLKRAFEPCQQAVDIFERAGESQRLELGTAYHNLAAIYALQGKSRKALDAVSAGELEADVATRSSVLRLRSKHRGSRLCKA